MAKLTYFPDLGPQGWTDSIPIIIDKLMAHFFVSENSQTSIFPGKITSFPYLLQKYRTDPNGLATATQNALFDYFSRGFNNVATDCTIVDNMPDTSSLSLSIYIEFVDSKGDKHVVARVAESFDGKFTKLVNINNGVQ